MKRQEKVALSALVSTGRFLVYMCLLVASLAVAALACYGGNSPGALVFSPEELPNAQTGKLYEETIAISGNKTPVYSMSVNSGELPDGLRLVYEEGDAFARVIGIPYIAGEYQFSILATCLGTNVNGQMDAHTYKLIVK